MSESECFTIKTLQHVWHAYAQRAEEDDTITWPYREVTDAISNMTYDQMGDLLGIMATLFGHLPSEINIGTLDLHNAMEEFTIEMVMHAILGIKALVPAGETETEPRAGKFQLRPERMKVMLGILRGNFCDKCAVLRDDDGKCPSCNPEGKWWVAILHRFMYDRCHPGGAFQSIILGQPQVGRMDPQTRADLADILLWCDQHMPMHLRERPGFTEWCGTAE